MFTETKPTTKARFASLRFRSTPRQYTARQQEQAAALAHTVQAIKPGVYRVGSCFYSLWESACTCRAHRINKQRPCIHRVALWLSEGIQFDDPEPAKWLKLSGIDQPEIIAIYGRLVNCKGLYRIVSTGSRDGNGKQWFECFPLNGGTSTYAQAADMHHLAPFYE